MSVKEQKTGKYFVKLLENYSSPKETNTERKKHGVTGNATLCRSTAHQCLVHLGAPSVCPSYERHHIFAQTASVVSATTRA